jgi:hypothetical protein
VVISHFVEDGVPAEEAREWCGLGCVYPVCLQRPSITALMVLLLPIWRNAAPGLHNGIDINGRLTGVQTGDPRNLRVLMICIMP